MDSPAPKPTRRWPVALLVLLAFAGGVYVGTRLEPRRAAAEPEGPRVAARVFLASERWLQREGQITPPDLIPETQKEIVRSRMVLSAAFRRPEVEALGVARGHEDPVAWLASALRVDFTGREVMRIGLDGDNDEESRVLVDAVAAAYLEQVVGRDRAANAERLQKLNTDAAEYRATLARQRSEIARLKAADAGPQRDAELAPLQFEVDLTQKLLGHLSKHAQTLKNEQDAPPRAVLLEPATLRAAR